MQYFRNKIRGLHSFMDLTKHIKTRIDDSHAPPGILFLTLLKKLSYFHLVLLNIISISGKMYALHQIKSYNPQLEKFTVNSLDFRLCNITCQVENLRVSLY